LPEEPPQLPDYGGFFAANIEAGLSSTDAAIMVADAYLDGKPRRRGKRKITWAERDAAFWSSEFLPTLPAEAWHAESSVLALARYVGQSRVDAPELMEHLASIAPESVKRAIRYSGLVLQGQSPRRSEIARLAAIRPETFSDFVLILETFEKAYTERLAAVAALQQPLAELSPLDLLAYASLYAFENLVPRDLLSHSEPVDDDTHMQSVLDAINDLLIWKLRSTDDRSLRLTERDIAESLAQHLSPFLFPSPKGPRPRDDLYFSFEQLLAAQIELNSFISRSADAFSFDDDIEFVLRDGRLEIIERNPAGRTVWKRNGERLTRLHYYWMYRGIEAFAASDLVNTPIGRPENQEANRFAYIKAMGTHLRLTEAYGLADSVTTDSGLKVDLFQALLSLELMTAFFNADFLLPYLDHLKETGNWRLALGPLAFGGLLQPEMQNRLPITWSDRTAKIAKITGWTVNSDFPKGSAKAAEAILDFWTVDWAAFSARLRKGEKGLHPELFERPILKMGRYLFQLPWLVAMQNNASAAINNLRRIGARRPEAREETRRIEDRLASLFERRGFFVVRNFEPERVPDDDPGEVDLICARDGRLLVLEVKSTFLRGSKKEAWLHGTTMLRKAGLQLQRKVHAVEKALASDEGLAKALGMEPGTSPLHVSGWIVDTSIEHDHERFGGYLKVSLEELIIALRDDRHLLNDPAGLLSGGTEQIDGVRSPETDQSWTLYPDGFSASRFVQVIETEAVWDGPPRG
jgi:hypothetical protein